MRFITRRLFTLLLFAIFSVYHLSAQQDVLSERLEKHVSILASDSLEGRGLGSETMDLARNYIVSEFQSIGLEPFEGDYMHPFSIRVNLVRVTGKNLIGVLPGNNPDLKNEYIVVGAHYDHLGWKDIDGKKVIYNGADDNASGTSGIIELARILKTQNSAPDRTIIFVAFDGEESGLLGSNSLFADSVFTDLNIVAMFSFDMIGMYESNNGVALKGIESMEAGLDLLDKAAEGDSIKITQKGSQIARRTDTHPFGQQGIPAIHVFTGSGSPYHKPEDDFDKLDYNGMARVVEFNAKLINEMAQYPEIKPSHALADQQKLKVTPIQEKLFRFGYRLNVGTTYNNYADEFYRANSVFALQTGLYSQIRLNKNLSIAPELLYAYEGSKNFQGKLTYHSVTVPLIIVLGTSDLQDAQAYVLAGGYYSYAFAASVDNASLDLTSEFNQNNFGINAGVGFKVQKIQAGILYKYGVTDLNLVNTTGNVFEKGWYFSLGYQF